MGVALRRAGVQPSQLSGISHCSVHPRDEMHFINANQLANGIARGGIAGIGPDREIRGRRRRRVLSEDLRAHRHHLHPGLLAPLGDGGPPTGDHIDVWNGYRSSAKWLMEWFSWLGYYSNYAGAGEIWFWEVK